MKNPPTLADAVIATGIDKKMPGGPNPNNAEIRAYTTDVLHARKLVLDDAMSAYLANLGHSFWRGGLRKRIRMLENARRMARLPHPLTWIEFNYVAVIERTRALGIKIVRPPQTLPGEPFPARGGWLLRQHPEIETAFLATQAVTSMVVPGRAFIHPVSTAWCADDTPLPWRSIKLWQDDPGAEIVVTAIALRQRAHQVRGHRRRDWRNPLDKLCEHDFDDHMVCRRCHGHQIWIAEHQRGDASVGFVTHDYEIHKQNREAAE